MSLYRAETLGEGWVPSAGAELEASGAIANKTSSPNRLKAEVLLSDHT